MFIFTAHVCQVGQSIIPYLLDQGVRMRGAVNKEFCCHADGLTVESVVQVGSAEYAWGDYQCLEDILTGYLGVWDSWRNMWRSRQGQRK